MKTFDRVILSLTLLVTSALVLREGSYQASLIARRPDIVVSVSGAVLRPGVIQLPPDARTVHAIELCGGLSASADGEALDLAKSLSDGEHIIVAEILRRQPITVPVAQPLSSAEPAVRIAKKSSETFDCPGQEADSVDTDLGNQPALSGRAKSTVGERDPIGPLSINRATTEQLEALPGVGPVLAARIVEARQAAPGGTFGSLEELGAIRGIKGKTFQRLRPYLKIEGS